MNKKQLDNAMESLKNRSIVNHEETNEEFVNQIATFRQLQAFWFARTGESVSGWDQYKEALEAEVQYTLALKNRMLRDGVFFIETTTHTASLDGAASDLNTITPVIERKLD